MVRGGSTVIVYMSAYGERVELFFFETWVGVKMKDLDNDDNFQTGRTNNIIHSRWGLRETANHPAKWRPDMARTPVLLIRIHSHFRLATQPALRSGSIRCGWDVCM